MSTPTIIVICTPCEKGIMFFSHVAGYWRNTDAWPIQSSGTITILSDGISEADLRKNSLVPSTINISHVDVNGFFQSLGANSLGHYEPLIDASKSTAVYRLEKIAKLRHSYAEAGPYTDSCVIYVPSIAKNIGHDASVAMNAFVKPCDKTEFLRVCENTKQFFYDMRKFESCNSQTEHAFKTYATSVGRKTWEHYVIPDYTPNDQIMFQFSTDQIEMLKFETYASVRHAMPKAFHLKLALDNGMDSVDELYSLVFN